MLRVPKPNTSSLRAINFGLAHEDEDAEERDDADRHVHVEDPAPIVCIGKPAVERGADRADRHLHAPYGHRLDMRRIESSMVACKSGTSAAPNKPCSNRAATISTNEVDSAHAIDVMVKLATDTRNTCLRPNLPDSHPGERHADRGRDDVRREHPRNLILRRGQAAFHVRQRDVGDGAVEHLHDDREHHGRRDERAYAREDRVSRVRLSRWSSRPLEWASYVCELQSH